MTTASYEHERDPDPDRRWATFRHVTGLIELGSRVGYEITALVQEMHAVTSPLAALVPRRRPARIVYGGIQLGFRGAGRLAALGGRFAARDPDPDAWLDVQSALNGAFGHLFDEPHSGFVLPMALLRPERRGGGRLLVFLHGLCMNERAWRSAPHTRFAAWAQERLDAEVAYLRYNTGLRISRNGARLAELLERESPPREILLVGHSMGGLVALSALHQAHAKGLRWPERVTKLACLGAPHEGASLERLGNHANRLLQALPWTRPFMRLGNLRSDGIRDLRFGHLHDDEWRGGDPDDPRPNRRPRPLPSHVDPLLVAAVRRGGGAEDPLGDWLVPVGSALAQRLYPPEAARRERIRDLGHTGLLADERVYGLLRDWLEG